MTDDSVKKDRIAAASLRALAEAEARHKAAPERPKEIGGRKGLEPTRFGDWEKDGIAVDF